MNDVSEEIRFHIVFIWVYSNLHSVDMAWVITQLILSHMASIWLYLRLPLGTLHSFNFTSDCTGDCTWTLLGNNSSELYLSNSFFPEETTGQFYVRTTPMTLLENNSSELYLRTPINFTSTKSMNFTWEQFLWRVLQMILGSPPVNFIWEHFP